MSNLTKENYHTDPNYFHYSQLKVYLESKYLYFKRYVEKDPKFQFIEKPNILAGKMSDELLTEGATQYINKKVTKGENPEDFERLKTNPELGIPEGAYLTAKAISEQLPEHPIWQQLKGHGEFQKIMTGELDGNPVAIKLDSIIPNFACFDLKCSSEKACRNGHSWMYQCIDMGYDIQAGLYSHVTRLPFYFIACYLKNNILHVELFKAPQAMLDSGLAKAREAISGIKAGNFAPKLCSMDDAIEIPWVNQDNTETIDDDDDDDDKF